MHRLLQRQLARASRGRADGAPDYDTLLALISETYEEQDRERRLHDRSTRLMEEELRAANRQVQQQAEAHLRAILDTVGEGIVIVDRAGIVLSVNAALLALFGYEKLELLGTRLDLLLPAPEDGAAVMERIFTLGRESLARRKDGTTFPAELAVGDLSTTGLPHFVCILRDITERKETERTIRESQERFRDFAESTSDWFWELDADLRFSRFSGNFTNYTRMLPDHYVGHTRDEMMAPDTDPGIRRQNLEDMQARRPFRGLVYRTIAMDGPGRVLRVNGKPVFAEDGSFLGYRGTASDITEEVEAEERLEQAQAEMERLAQRNQSILESVDDGILGVDLNGRATFVNPGGARMLGYETGELVGTDILPAISANLETADTLYGVLLRLTEPIRDDNASFKRRDGSLLPVEYIASPVLEHDTQLGVVIGFRDITQRRLVERQLREAKEAAEAGNRSKSEFLATMSHEIRTPMNGVIGMTGLLLDTELTEEQRHFAETIRDSGESLLTVINDILDFSKMEAGKLDLDYTEFELSPLVESVVDILAPRAHAKGIEIASLIDPSLRKVVRGDPGRLRQILMNLAGNAVKFTERGGVSIELRPLEKAEGRALVRFEIRDTGIGIPKEAQARLFTMFQQVDASTARRYGGTGLGLAISRRLASLMGGQVGVESEAGLGSRFWIDMPLAVLGDAGMATPDLRGRRVLVVDDNAINRDVVMRQLSAFGVEALSFPDAGSAMSSLTAAAAEGRAWEVALIDSQMPVVSGCDMARMIRAIPILSSTRIILTSSQGMVPSEEGSIDAFLHKPLRQNTILDTIARVLGVSTRKADRPKAGSSGIPSDNAQRRMRILVAEDNPVNQQVALGLLRKFGHSVDVVGNGAEALEAVRLLPYDLVLMDVQMPEMDGLEATRQIRRLPEPQGNVPIVAMTANAMRGDDQICLDAGMDGYISKPIDRQKLADILGQYAGMNQDAEVEATPRPDTPPPVVAVDWAVLDLLKEDLEAETVIAILDKFMEDARIRVRAADSAAGESDLERVRREAHTIKGAAASLGLSGVRDRCLALENAAKTEGDVLEAVRALDAAIEALPATLAPTPYALTGA